MMIDTEGGVNYYIPEHLTKQLRADYEASRQKLAEEQSTVRPAVDLTQAPDIESAHFSFGRDGKVQSISASDPDFLGYSMTLIGKNIIRFDPHYIPELGDEDTPFRSQPIGTGAFPLIAGILKKAFDDPKLQPEQRTAAEVWADQHFPQVMEAIRAEHQQQAAPQEGPARQTSLQQIIAEGPGASRGSQDHGHAL